MGNDLQIFGVAEAHDEHLRASGQIIHSCLHRLGMLTLHANLLLRRKNSIPAIHPDHLVRQGSQNPHQRVTNMSGTKQRHMARGLGQLLR